MLGTKENPLAGTALAGIGVPVNMKQIVLCGLVAALLLSSFVTGEPELEPREVWLSECASAGVRISVWGATAETLGQIRRDRFAGKTASYDDL